MSMKRYLKNKIYEALYKAKQTGPENIDKEVKKLYKDIEILWE
jgi:hypothetical protein